jgi:hypothetical protein
MIFALCGLPRVGKDEFAKTILSTHKNVLRYAFADPIKQMCCIAFGWDISIFESSKKDEIDEYWKVKPREMLEFVGTECLRKHICKEFPIFKKFIGEKIWVKRFEKFYLENKHKDIIITDLRFDPEFEFLQTIEKKSIIKIERPNFECDKTKAYDIEKHQFDILLNNDVEDLFYYKAKINELYNLIKRSK